MPLTDTYIKLNEMEVIGNVFDNPEILEEHPKDWHEVITKETWDEYDEWKQTEEGKRIIGKL